MKDSELKCQSELGELKKEFDDFIYIVSHDIKSPMRAISNLTTWIEEDFDKGLNQDMLSNLVLLRNRVNRLENMMNSLLDLSRIDRMELEFYEIDIIKMIENTIQLLDINSNVEFRITPNIENRTCFTLGTKLKKVILSVIDNAIQFTDKKETKVAISIIENKSDYIIEIADNGPGIPNELVERIFTIFYTVNSKDIVNSTGAGLALSKKILKLVGGSIQYSPGLETGSIFTINWPKKITLNN